VRSAGTRRSRLLKLFVVDMEADIFVLVEL